VGGDAASGKVAFHTIQESTPAAAGQCSVSHEFAVDRNSAHGRSGWSTAAFARRVVLPTSSMVISMRGRDDGTHRDIRWKRRKFLGWFRAEVHPA